MLVKVGSYLLVPFLVLVATDRPGLVGLLHEPGSRPLAAQVQYLPIARKWQSHVVRAIEILPRVTADPWAVPHIVPVLGPEEVRRADSLVIPARGKLYVLMSLQI